jgi:hypothetical protein
MSATAARSTPRAGRARAGRAWAYAGLIFGSGASVAANVGHAFLRPTHLDPGAEWHPQIGAIAWGVAVAVALLISVEVLARVNWPAAKGWYAVRYAGGGVVALVAAATSYRHLSDLLAHWHETGPIVTFGPAIVDGLMILCSFALMAPDAPAAAGGSDRRAGDLVERGSDPRPAIDPIREPTDRVRIDGPAPDPDPAAAQLDDPIRGGAPQIPEPERSADPDGVLIRPRADDLARARAGILAGELPPNPTVKALREHLKIGPAYARATRDALRQEPPPNPTRTGTDPLAAENPATPPGQEAVIPGQPLPSFPKATKEYAYQQPSSNHQNHSQE